MDDLKILKEHVQQAPVEIKEFLSSEFSTILDFIVSNQHLITEQAASLENEIVFVLVGLDLKSNFQKNIESELSISPVVAEIISADVFGKIFSPFQSFFPNQEASKLVETPLKETHEIPPINLSSQLEIEPPKPELLISVPSYTQTTTPTHEENLPAIIEPKKFGYGGGVDPYREPTT